MYLSNMNIHNIHSIHNPNQYSLSSDKVNIPENFAKNMPNALIKVSETQINKNINNNLNNNYLKQMYTPRLAPSTGSLTENFIKSRAGLSPLYKFNEAATKYEAMSVAPIFSKQIKKNVDLFI